MSKEQLDRFFVENPTGPQSVPSDAALEHMQIMHLISPVMNEETRKKISEKIFALQPTREAEVMAGQKEIEDLTSAQQVLKFLRRGVDPINQGVLVQKALEFEDEIVPEIIKMMQTSLNDVFIACATRVLAICKMDIARELMGIYDSTRSPYAQSLILLACGFKGDSETIAWLIEKYHELKKQYPNETYCQGASYALFEIEKRLYPQVTPTPPMQPATQ